MEGLGGKGRGFILFNVTRKNDDDHEVIHSHTKQHRPVTVYKTTVAKSPPCFQPVPIFLLSHAMAAAMTDAIRCRGER